MATKKKRRRMRCPKCGSLRTKQNGKRRISPVSFDLRTKREVQKYKCLECGKTFSNRQDTGKKYTFHFKLEVTRMHVEERMSYRIISKRIKEKYGKKVSATYLCKMVNEVAERSKGSIQILKEYRPKWKGYLTVDDKYINEKGEKRLSLLAIDSSGDYVHMEMCEGNGQEEYDRFFYFLKERLGYRVKGITTDLDERLEKAINTVFGVDTLHQKCIKHALDNLRKMIGLQESRRAFYQLSSIAEGNERRINKARVIELKGKRKAIEEEYKQKEKFVADVKQMLYCEHTAESRKCMDRIGSSYPIEFAEAIRFISKNYDELLTHQKDKNILKTNNQAENANKQIKRRLKTIEAFQCFNTAFNYLNLLRNYLRFKPYTDCRGKRKSRNGYSPMELCKAKYLAKDWLINSVNFP
jgi:transposase-like protein/DNA-directed RNA polymerase subunit RPC12/RpoP